MELQPSQADNFALPIFKSSETSNSTSDTTEDVVDQVEINAESKTEPDGAVVESPLRHAVVSISATGLTKYFGNVCAVNQVSLDIHEGEFFGFLGPNGAGKSTTIRMLCGLLRPDAGMIRVAGFDAQMQTLEMKRVIGVLPEETNLYERLTGREFLSFSGRMYGLNRDEVDSRSRDLLELMELTEQKDKMIVDYSMGMRKKIAMAAALIHRPKVMFLDEPFNGIDPVSVRAIRNVLRHLTDHGTTIFISSHVMEVVERLCSRVAIINRGQIVGIGTLKELREMAHTTVDSSLEDVFLKMVDANVEREALSWL